MVTLNGRFYAQMRVTLSDGKTKVLRRPFEATRLDLAIVEAEGKTKLNSFPSVYRAN